MSRIEQAGYPYAQDSHGIPFEYVGWGRANRVVGGSGSELEYSAEEQEFLVRDLLKPQYMLCAFINASGGIGFNLRSEIGRISRRRHPDMFAAIFVDFAFHKFELLGHDIRNWHVVWERASDNYRQLSSLLDAGHDIQSAATNTWTGKIATKHGFVFDPSSVMEIQGPEQIEADFRR